MTPAGRPPDSAPALTRLEQPRRHVRRGLILFSLLLCLALTVLPAAAAARVPAAVAAAPWWFWPGLLFLFTLVAGVISVLAGTGGGVLFVPLVGGFFPFHFDFVRCTGLLVALANSLSAGPSLFRRQIASLNLTILPALITSVSAVAGAFIGLLLPEKLVMFLLGLVILGIAGVMFFSQSSEFPQVLQSDRLSRLMFFSGAYHEAARDRTVDWQTHRTAAGLRLFVLVGLVAGMFGLGAGWANVPVLNLVMGVPLKVAVGTSTALIGVTTPPAALVYINSGALLPIIAVPSIAGMALGARLGAKMLVHVEPTVIRRLVIGVMVVSALRILARSLA